MDWLPAAATGRDARRDALLDQLDFVPVISLIPNHRSSRWLFEHPIRASEVTVLPPTQVEPLGTTFAVADPYGACWSCPPWCHQSGGGTPLLRLDAVG